MGEAITIFGDGQQTRDFIYVADIVRTLRASMDKMHSGEVKQLVSNACTELSVSVNKLADIMVEVSGVKVAIDHKDAREGDIKHSRGNAKVMNNILGVTAETTLKQGLEALWKSL